MRPILILDDKILCDPKGISLDTASSYFPNVINLFLMKFLNSFLDSSNVTG